MEIELSALTDSFSSDDHNFKLSDNRADSCMKYILSKGISPNPVASQDYEMKEKKLSLLKCLNEIESQF